MKEGPNEKPKERMSQHRGPRDKKNEEKKQTKAKENGTTL